MKFGKVSPPLEAAWPEFPQGEDRVELATFKTTFNKIDASIAEALIHRGWWLAGANLATYQPDLLPADLTDLAGPADGDGGPRRLALSSPA